MRIRWIFYFDWPEKGISFRHYFSTSLQTCYQKGVCVCVCVCVCVYIYTHKAADTETERDKVYADVNWLHENTNPINKQKLHQSLLSSLFQK
jgi:hypothetical protein